MNWLSIGVFMCLSMGLLGVAHGMETCMVPMRDGAKLATFAHLPDGDGPWPVVLMRGAGNGIVAQELAVRFTDAGYALVTQWLRGEGESEGDWDQGQGDTAGWGEIQDGYDTVAWIAGQEWCDGKIGTWGGSYAGNNQHLMAGSYPPDLVCQHFRHAASDLSSNGYLQGGIPRVNIVGTDAWEPINMTALEERYDSNARVAGMSYAGFHIGGWYDLYQQSTLDGFVARQYQGGPGSAGNQKLIIGPWGHGEDRLVTGTIGDLTFPEDSKYTSYWSDCIKFFDYWLKGIDDGYTELPTVRYYVMGDAIDPTAPGNEWREAEDWPIPYTNYSLYLSQEGLVPGPGPDSADTYSYDPENPVPWVEAPMAFEEGQVEDREDVLVYSTQPLSVPVDITGRIYLELYASSSCPDTDFIAKLTDVYPDGRSMIVAEGGLRARKRSMGKEELLEPGEVYEFWIDLLSTSIVFNKGHRIRVVVTSSSYPGFGINPNTGLPAGTSTEKRIAENAVHMGAENPSRIILPLTGPDSDGDGLYDIYDPVPGEAGPHTKEEIAAMIQETHQLIASIPDQKLQEVLMVASGNADSLLSDGDVAGAGHIVLLVQSILSDIPEISIPEARAVVDVAVDLALGMARQARHGDMIEYLTAGWKVGGTMQICEELPLLLDQLEEASMLMAKDPASAMGLADWCNKTSVQLLARAIQGYEESWQELASAVSERDLKILEGIFLSVKKELVDRSEETCAARLAQFEGRLDQLGIEMAESILIPGFLTAICVFYSALRTGGRGFSVAQPETG